MLSHIKTFFFPNQSIFLYHSDKELIDYKLNEIFNRRWNLFDNNNLEGAFVDKDTFEIRMKSAYKAGLMIGEIKEANDGQTEINLKIKPFFGLYILFYFFIIFSIVYLFNSINAGSIKYILISCLMLIGGPFLCIGVSNIQIEALKENYVKYIDKMLRAI